MPIPKKRALLLSLALLFVFIFFIIPSCVESGRGIHISDVSAYIASRDESTNSVISSDQSDTASSDESIAVSSEPDESSRPDESSLPDESWDPPIKDDYMRGIWVSQFDMQSVYLDEGVQRSKSIYTALVKTIVENIKNDSYNTVFLQMRPYGDSFYESEYYPLSRFVAGSYGGSISYDPIEIFIAQANAAGLSVHGWINPLRLMLKEEIASVGNNFLIKQWYNAGNGKVVEVSGRLYLNPAYSDVRELITDGAAEIIKKYNVDGIHIDDYFYPTSAASFDSAAYASSGYTSLVAFRENNISLLVGELYSKTHKTDSAAIFGVSPAGNLATVRVNHYADVAKWCSQDGYLDYILPQIYFGFLHGSCPFAKTVDDWAAIVTNPNVKYYVGLSGGNAFGAYDGAVSTWAGTEEGKYEWINNKDVLKRSFEYIFNSGKVDGYVFFCYQYLYSPTSGTPVINLAEEYANYIAVVKQY
ncbi:MAG: hypothetical protein CVU97_01685 [Firmicutes bacterium HGW-Firmicutes-21]|nr:MAG: hypothetical protein CVU97_01685 [Firmicutes bacterium HGW-Firmicutes-21]